MQQRRRAAAQETESSSSSSSTAPSSPTKADSKAAATTTSSSSSSGTMELLATPAIAVVGLGLSLQMVRDHYDPGQSICDVGGRVSCSLLNKGAFSEIAGVPISVLGVWWYVALLWVSLMAVQAARRAQSAAKSQSAAATAAAVAAEGRHWAASVGQLYCNLAGIGFVFYLVGVEIYVGAICPMCTVVHALTCVTTVLAVRQFGRAEAVRRRYSGSGSSPVVVGGMVATVQALPGPLIFWQSRLLRRYTVVMGALVGATAVAFNTTGLGGAAQGIGTDTMAGHGYSERGVDEFARCLTNRGFVMYGSNACSHCKRQKTLFGESFRHIKFITCEQGGQEPTPCERVNVEAFPTWIQRVERPSGSSAPEGDSSGYDETAYTEVRRLMGTQNLDQLQEASLCELID